MVNAKAVPTPLPVGYAPVKSLDKAADPELRKRYQTVIGSLLYLMLVLSRREVSARQDAMTYLVRMRELLNGW